MKKNININISYVIWVIALISSLICVFSLSFVKIDDYDVWWHLKCGELIIKTSSIINKEIFSYTANGSPWVDGYIPAQILMYFAYNIGNLAGVTIFGALIVLILALMDLYLSNKSKISLCSAILLLPIAYFCAHTVILQRPALFTPLFALLQIYILDNYKLKQNRNIYYILPLTLFWTSSHPGFPLSIIITSIYLIGTIIDHYIRFSNKQTKNTTIITYIILILLQIVVTFINPNGLKAYYSIIQLASNPELKHNILEWKMMFVEPAEPRFTRESFIFLIALYISTVFLSFKSIKTEYILLFIFITVSTIFGRRNLLLFSSTIIPLTAWNLEKLKIKRKMILKRLSNCFIINSFGLFAITISLILSWLTFTNRIYYYTNVLGRSGYGIQEGIFPTKAVEILKNEKIKGNIFHPYCLGGYLLFELYPKYKVFIDGRIYPYPYEIFQKEEKAFEDANEFVKLQERYDIRILIIPLIPDSYWPVVWGFMKSPSWAVVQADGGSVMFMLRGAGNDEIIAKYEMNLLQQIPPLEHKKPGRKFMPWNVAEYPYGQIHWGKIYEKINYPELAALAVESALDYIPKLKSIDAWYGYLLISAGRYDEGYEILQKQLTDKPNDVGSLIGMGNYYIYKQEFQKAEETLLKASMLAPEESGVWNTLGTLAINRGDMRLAVERLEKAVKFGPLDGKYWENLGIALETINAGESFNALNKALQLYEEEIPGGEDSIRVRNELAKFKQ